MLNGFTERVDMTPAQCRAARGLLGITQPKLAELAGFGLSTIVDFEKERRTISTTAHVRIIEALEIAGIQFISEDGMGIGIRYAKI